MNLQQPDPSCSPKKLTRTAHFYQSCIHKNYLLLKCLCLWFILYS